MLKEYETKFVIGEIVKFFVGGDPYVGEISKIFVDEYFKDIVRYEINSKGIDFVRYESAIEPYETETDEDYICEDCLLSQILDDVEEGELTANEAREILGLETIDEELEDYEHKTAGNAYFSIFPDDEHEDAVHIEIDPTWLWTKEDIDELISQLNWAKARNSNNDFRVEEVVDYDFPKSIFKFENSINVAVPEYTGWASTRGKDFTERLKLENADNLKEKNLF